MAQQSTTGHKIDDVVLLNRRTTVEVDWNGGKTIQHSMYNEPPMIWLHDKEVTFRSGDPGERELHLEKNKSNGALRVIKTIKKDSTSLDAFYREVYGMGMCKTAPEASRYLVQLDSWFESRYSYHIAMEYCPLGDVHSYYTRRGIPPENYTRTIIWQVLRGLHYLHHLDIAHRDLKPRNILIMEAPPTSTNLWVKLADFGVAKRAKSSDTTITQQRSRCGTQGYMAPEVVWSDGKGYTKACDIWSLGCTQLWLFSQEKLNYNDFIDDKRTQIQQNLINRGFSSDAVDFISQALSRKPEDRPTPGQALSMSWFRGVVTKVESSIGPDNAFENHAHTAYTSTGLFSSGSPCSMTFFPSNHGAGDEPEGMGDDDDTFKESKRPMPGQFYQSVPEPRNPQRGFVPKMLNKQARKDTIQEEPVRKAAPLDNFGPVLEEVEFIAKPFNKQARKETIYEPEPSAGKHRGPPDGPLLKELNEPAPGQFIRRQARKETIREEPARSNTIPDTGPVLEEVGEEEEPEEPLGSPQTIFQDRQRRPYVAGPTSPPLQSSESANGRSPMDAASVPISPLIEAVKNRDQRGVDSLLYDQSSIGFAIDDKDQHGRTALWYASSLGLKRIIHQLLDKGAKIGEKDNLGACAFHTAAASGGQEVVELFLKEPDSISFINATTKDMQTALHLAAGRNQAHVIHSMVQEGGPRLDTTVCNQDGNTPLMLAIESGWEEAFDALTASKSGPSIAKHVTPGGCSALWSAVVSNIDQERKWFNKLWAIMIRNARNNQDVVKELRDPLFQLLDKISERMIDPTGNTEDAATKANLERDLDFLFSCLREQKQFDRDGCYRLIARELFGTAIEKNKPLIIKILADVDRKEAFHLIDKAVVLKSMMDAVEKGLTDLAVQLVRFKDFPVNSDTHRGQTPLIAASLAGQATVVEALLDNKSVKIDVEFQQIRTGHTATIAAAYKGHHAVAFKLLDFGARQITTAPICIALHTAVAQGQSSFVKRLFRNFTHAKTARDLINVRDSTGNTALTAAATLKEGASLIRELVDKGGDVKVCDRDGRTPLALSIELGHFENIKALLDLNIETIGIRDRTGRTPLEMAIDDLYRIQTDGKMLVLLLKAVKGRPDLVDDSLRKALIGLTAYENDRGKRFPMVQDKEWKRLMKIVYSEYLPQTPPAQDHAYTDPGREFPRRPDSHRVPHRSQTAGAAYPGPNPYTEPVLSHDTAPHTPRSPYDPQGRPLHYEVQPGSSQDTRRGREGRLYEDVNKSYRDANMAYRGTNQSHHQRQPSGEAHYSPSRPHSRVRQQTMPTSYAYGAGYNSPSARPSQDHRREPNRYNVMHSGFVPYPSNDQPAYAGIPLPPSPGMPSPGMPPSPHLRSAPLSINPVQYNHWQPDLGDTPRSAFLSPDSATGRSGFLGRPRSSSNAIGGQPMFYPPPAEQLRHEQPVDGGARMQRSNSFGGRGRNDAAPLAPGFQPGPGYYPDRQGY